MVGYAMVVCYVLLRKLEDDSTCSKFVYWEEELPPRLS